MQALLPPVPVVNHLLDSLEQQGYGVEQVALNPAFMLRPESAAVVMRFGDHIDGLGRSVIAGLEVRIDVRGDLSTGELRRWRIAKTFKSRNASFPTIHLDSVFTLNGDISAAFFRREGKTGLAMMQSLIADMKAALQDIRPVRRLQPEHGPIIHLETMAAGKIAIGRCGLLRRHDGRQPVTLEARALRLMVCDHIADIILPEFMKIGAAIVTKARIPPSSQRFSRPALVEQAVPT